MKNFYFGFALFFLVVLLVFGFANLNKATVYFFGQIFSLPVMIPIFTAALFGGLGGISLMHGLHLHWKEKEEDADFM